MVPPAGSDSGTAAARDVAAESAALPPRLIFLNQRVLGSTHKPVAIYYEEAAGYLRHFDVAPTIYLAVVLR